jgi:hypothetical protein
LQYSAIVEVIWKKQAYQLRPSATKKSLLQRVVILAVRCLSSLGTLVAVQEIASSQSFI